LRILFTTSNGTGLGHLTRSMAIARRLGPEVEPLFLTLSAAAPVVRQMGFPVEYVASYATPGSGNDYRWSRRLRARLRAVIAEAEPAVMVFDGTHPYEALLGALPSSGVAVWCRRPLWKAGSSRVPLGRAGAFDAVLEPGELAESEDRGPTVELRGRATRVGPIVLLDRSELLPRAEAEAELGLEPGRTNVLVTLGQGAEVREATARCLRHLTGNERVQVAALRSTIAAIPASGGLLAHNDQNPPAVGQRTAGVVELEATYPMSRHFNAFDAAIAAAGYNAFHELIALGVPALYVPMARETDDQAARARWAESAGLGLGTDGPADLRLEAQLDRLLDAGERDAIAERLAELAEPTGAADAARWLTDLAAPAQAPSVDSRAAAGGQSTPGATGGRAGSGREFRRRWGQFLTSLPRTLARLTRQQLTQPRVRTVVLAVGIGDDAVAGAVAATLEESGEEPARTLVVTDSLALGPLRALGVGIEHVPGRAERQPELAGGTYEDFLRRRLDLILAERPKPRHTVVAPGGAPLP
jgi:spore coat polysaccharide biosynthesis predicted glycosyltransferase SpsG